jgi:hypothetical protein
MTERLFKLSESRAAWCYGWRPIPMAENDPRLKKVPFGYILMRYEGKRLYG